MKKFLFIIALFPLCAFAQEAVADISIMQLIQEAVANFGSLKGLEGQAMVLGCVSLGIRVLLSSVKVSVLREKLWNKLSENMKMLVAPVCGLLLAVLSIQPLTLSAVLAGMLSGVAAIPLHHLLKTIEALPGINKTVQVVVGMAAKILGGKIGQ